MAKMIKRIAIRLIKRPKRCGDGRVRPARGFDWRPLIATMIAPTGGINSALNTAITAMGGIAAPAPASPLPG